MVRKSPNICPQCGTPGHSVDNATIKCLISTSLHRVENVKHYFCPDAGCSVVYFAEDGSHLFLTEDLRERVYQKEPNSDDVLVCYCFLHTLGGIRSSITDDGQSSIIDDIKYGIQQGHCACDWRNPEGKCCLGNVVSIVKAGNVS
ncbi:MAG: hypothetical protein K8L99_31065 [Anaerolineae bacterium]|nr:hypothetical protein [Anaerolineae bacterium]